MDVRRMNDIGSSNLLEQAIRTALGSVPLAWRRRVKSVTPVALKRIILRGVAGRNRTEGPVRSDDGRLFERSKEGVIARLALEGDYEPELTQIVRSILQEGDIAVDVGANFGWYSTLFAGLVGPSGHVFSFEPVVQTFSQLVRNIELNEVEDIVSVKNLAVGESAGWVEMQNDAGGTQSALAYAVESKGGIGAVEMVALQDALAQHRSGIALLKIDIEGFEEQALVGANSLIACENPPMIQLELNEVALRRAGSSRASVMTMLQNFGYELYDVGYDSRLRLAGDAASDIFAGPGRGAFAHRLGAIA